TIYGVQDGVPEQVDAIVRSSDDTVWMAGGGKVFKFAHAATKPELVANLGIQDEPVIALLPVLDSNLWIRTSLRVGKLAVQSSTSPVWIQGKLPRANGQGGPTLDHKGNLLLPTYKGLYRWTGDHWQVIDHHNGLTSSAVFSALEDREGGIWVGTAGAGLDHWRGSGQWSGWTDSEGLPDALVLGVVRDSRNRLWVGTNSALTIWDPAARAWHTWKQDRLGNLGVSQILKTKDGAVWALFPNKGLFRFDADSEHPRAEQAPQMTSHAPPARIAAAPDGSIWAAGRSSLHVVRYHQGSFEIQKVKVPAEEINAIQNVSISPGGVVWTGGPQGLARFANGRWQLFRKDDGLLATDVLAVRAIQDEEVWVGYPDEGAVTRIHFSDGHLTATNFAKAKCALDSDARQDVWLEMDQGVGVVSPDGTLRRFTQRDGLIWNDINCDAFWNEADGSVFIGTSNGLAHYDPEREAPPPAQPKVVLMSAFFGKLDHLQERSPEIAYQDSTFVAHFAAPIFYDPDEVSCRFRLGG
ncbi:MAG TPA: two-component regulator propeller domain-containing protein, partial [Candidatus Angelobacter sp.]|nr:two-component regulator propeller domain-containing protein [Candidatus Angelobacter sp.]